MGKVALLGTAVEALLVNPQWCPKMNKLELPNHGESGRDFMQAIRTVSRKRKNLQIQLTSAYQYKKWGDWELSVSQDMSRKGMK